jgi:hypothetical protein
MMMAGQNVRFLIHLFITASLKIYLAGKTGLLRADGSHMKLARKLYGKK